MRSQSFVITGMTCANCVNTVSKTLNQSDKIMEATVNLATEKAKIVADDNISDQEIINLVEKAGYGDDFFLTFFVYGCKLYLEIKYRRGKNAESIICNYRNDLCKLCKYSFKNIESVR